MTGFCLLWFLAGFFFPWKVRKYYPLFMLHTLQHSCSALLSYILILPFKTFFSFKTKILVLFSFATPFFVLTCTSDYLIILHWFFFSGTVEREWNRGLVNESIIYAEKLARNSINILYGHSLSFSCYKKLSQNSAIRCLHTKSTDFMRG